MKYPCDVIRDLLPLYVDEVCSTESRKMVEDHMTQCPECKAYMDSMSCDGSQADAEIRLDPSIEKQKAASLRGIRKKLLRKQILTALITLVSIVCIGAAVVGGLKSAERIVVYEDNLSVSMVDGNLIGRLYGSSYTALKIKNISVDSGNSSNYIFYKLSDTVWDDISTGEGMMTEYMICPKDKNANMINRVYYYTGDFSELENMDEAQLQAVLQNSVLLWKKEP